MLILGHLLYLLRSVFCQFHENSQQRIEMRSHAICFFVSCVNYKNGIICYYLLEVLKISSISFPINFTNRLLNLTHIKCPKLAPESRANILFIKILKYYFIFLVTSNSASQSNLYLSHIHMPHRVFCMLHNH